MELCEKSRSVAAAGGCAATARGFLHVHTGERCRVGTREGTIDLPVRAREKTVDISLYRVHDNNLLLWNLSNMSYVRYNGAALGTSPERSAEGRADASASLQGRRSACQTHGDDGRSWESPWC